MCMHTCGANPRCNQHTFLCESVICVKAQNKKEGQRLTSASLKYFFQIFFLSLPPVGNLPQIFNLRFWFVSLLFTSGGLCLPAVLILLHPRVLLQSFRGNGRGGFRAVAYLRVGSSSAYRAPSLAAGHACAHAKNDYQYK